MTASTETSTPKRIPSSPRTAMEVYEYLPETTRCEVIDGVMYFPPERRFEHQDVLIDVAVNIHLHIEQTLLGKCIHGPLSVYFDGSNVVEPDIIFLKTERLNIIQGGRIRSSPDLLIEFLSNENRNHDLIRKFELYQKFAVPEYIIIDPLTKDVIHYVLQEGIYQQQPSQNGTFHSQVLQATFSF